MTVLSSITKQRLKNCFSAVVLLCCVVVNPLVNGQAPEATVTGPIAFDPYPSRDSIYSGSAIELDSAGYIEEEYFIEGRANRYVMEGLETAKVSDEGHRYKTRIIVRRPKQASDFNSIVVVEWINVTGGPDKDIDWWQSGQHFIRGGYGFVAVSAQQMGIDTMKQWSPERYATLDTTHDGMVTRDGLSFDIFSAVGKAISRTGEQLASGSVDFMGGLKADMILATGHSQSASRLGVYVNNIHPLEPVYDGVMIHGGGSRVRDDGDIKIFRVMAETDMARRAATRQPDTNNYRQWEVAGSSHVDVPFEIEYGKTRALREGTALDAVVPRPQNCRLPPYSTVPFRDVMNAAFEHLVSWVRDDISPPLAQPLQVAQMHPVVEFARDDHGNILGGIRLAEHVVATAKNTGMNDGANNFCRLYGSHEPFSEDTLNSLYPTHESYVNAVRQTVEANLSAGYILPYAARRTIEEAEASNIGKGILP